MNCALEATKEEVVRQSNILERDGTEFLFSVLCIWVGSVLYFRLMPGFACFVFVFVSLTSFLMCEQEVQLQGCRELLSSSLWKRLKYFLSFRREGIVLLIHGTKSAIHILLLKGHPQCYKQSIFQRQNGGSVSLFSRGH